MRQLVQAIAFFVALTPGFPNQIYGQDIAAQDIAAEHLLPILKAIEASIETNLAQITFSAKFKLDSGWSESSDAIFDDDFFAGQKDPELEKAHGRFFVRPDAMKYEFVVDSPFHMVGGQTSLASETFVQNQRIEIRFMPQQKSVEGSILDEKTTVQHSAKQRRGRGVFGMYFSPFSLQGYVEGSLFGRTGSNNGFLYSARHEDYPKTSSKALRILAQRMEPEPFSIEWIFDMSRGSPLLMEMHETGKTIVFDDFLELSGGITFPTRSITVRGPFVVNNQEKFHVVRWTYFDIVKDSPPESQFFVEFQDRKRLFGIAVPENTRRLNLFEIEADSLTNENLGLLNSGTIDVDEAYAAKNNDDSNSFSQSILFVCLVAVAFFSGVMLIRQMRS